MSTFKIWFGFKLAHYRKLKMLPKHLWIWVSRTIFKD